MINERRTIHRRAAEIEAGDLIIVEGMPYLRRVDSVGVDVAAYDGQNGLRRGEAGVRIKGDHINSDGSSFGDIRGWQTLQPDDAVFTVIA